MSATSDRIVATDNFRPRKLIFLRSRKHIGSTIVTLPRASFRWASELQDAHLWNDAPMFVEDHPSEEAPVDELTKPLDTDRF
jgi:hypothetical protein